MFKRTSLFDTRLRVVSSLMLVLVAAIVVKLFILQVVQHEYYTAMAMDTHEIYKMLYPRRGTVYFQDARSGREYPAAINRAYYLIYAVPREIERSEIASTTDKLAAILGYDEREKELLTQKLLKENDPYEPIQRKVSDETADRIKAAGLKGVYLVNQDYRYYPEKESGAHVLGFTSFDDSGALRGRYGAEGYWEDVLAGKGGYMTGERSARGSWISLAGRTLRSAEDGADIVLTIDRTLQYKACQRLRRGFQEFQVRSAALILMDVNSGAIRAMCSMPDYDPNEYAEVEDVSVFNNTSIFTPYEPGSVFKPLTMAAALDLGLVTPDTEFTDPGSRRIDGFTIHNALNKKYGRATMTKVLENSINTGMIWVQEQIGRERFKEYVERFGFGDKAGISLDTEVGGNISSLDKAGQIYGAVGSFGQGLTVTPLQLVTAYAALANDGQLPKPRIVEMIRYPDGRIERTEPSIVGTVISSRADKLITGMLVSVVDKTYSFTARMRDYYAAGKTGTAQIPGRGGYTDETNHTFLGYAPASNPKFVMLVKYEAPKRAWAESTTAPVFREVMEFALEYYGVPGDRKQ